MLPNPEIFFKIRSDKKVVDTRFSRIYDFFAMAGAEGIEPSAFDPCPVINIQFVVIIIAHLCAVVKY